MMPAIKDKPTMRALYERGQFGNRFQTWPLDAARRGELTFPIGLMYNGRPGIRLPHYAQPIANVFVLCLLLDHWQALGCDLSLVTVSQSDCTSNAGRVIQGEVMRDEHYLSLTYTRVDDIMRSALATETRHADGLAAQLMLRAAMDAPSWDTLQDIWERYPDAVVEFTVFNRGVGTLGHNTVFWEVREY
ncbi:MAG TPA: hypothetical protein VGL77_19795 [Armatimonadota bacterium]|jgi:hypothetical protein